MDSKPKVSLIIPLYNAKDFCTRMMESLAAQTYTNIQLILVNDGSTDNTGDIVCSYKNCLEEKGFDFLYIYQNNKGVGGAINTGLKKVQGEFLCWADQDDYYEPDAFEIRVRYMTEHPECAALTCNAFYMDIASLDTKHIVGNMKYSDDPNQFNHLLDYESLFCPGCHMLRVSSLKEVNPDMDIFEDKKGQNWQLLLPVYYRFERHHLDVPIYNYIIHQGSVSHFDKSYEDYIKWYDENLNIITQTILRMLIPEKEKIEIIKKSELLHLKVKMNVAFKHNMVNDFKNYYSALTELGGVSIKDRIKHLLLLVAKTTKSIPK